MTRCIGILTLLTLTLLLDAPRANSQRRLGVSPQDAWNCSSSHPIKGNFTTYSGEPCIYHMPGGRFYPKAKPERCYASAEEAEQDGCRRSKR
jgi:hypothetical protein